MTNQAQSNKWSLYGGYLCGAFISVFIPAIILLYGYITISFIICIIILLIITFFIIYFEKIIYIKISFVSFLSACSLMVSLDVSFLESLFPIKDFELSNYLSFWIGSVWTGIVFIIMQDKVNEAKQNQTPKN